MSWTLDLTQPVDVGHPYVMAANMLGFWCCPAGLGGSGNLVPNLLDIRTPASFLHQQPYCIWTGARKRFNFWKGNGDGTQKPSVRVNSQLIGDNDPFTVLVGFEEREDFASNISRDYLARNSDSVSTWSINLAGSTSDLGATKTYTGGVVATSGGTAGFTTGATQSFQNGSYVQLGLSWSNVINDPLTLTPENRPTTTATITKRTLRGGTDGWYFPGRSGSTNQVSNAAYNYVAIFKSVLTESAIREWQRLAQREFIGSDSPLRFIRGTAYSLPATSGITASVTATDSDDSEAIATAVAISCNLQATDSNESATLAAAVSIAAGIIATDANESATIASFSLISCALQATDDNEASVFASIVAIVSAIESTDGNESSTIIGFVGTQNAINRVLTVSFILRNQETESLILRNKETESKIYRRVET